VGTGDCTTNEMISEEIWRAEQNYKETRMKVHQTREVSSRPGMTA
jgi:hypothetical protein